MLLIVASFFMFQEARVAASTTGHLQFCFG